MFVFVFKIEHKWKLGDSNDDDDFEAVQIGDQTDFTLNRDIIEKLIRKKLKDGTFKFARKIPGRKIIMFTQCFILKNSSQKPKQF